MEKMQITSVEINAETGLNDIITDFISGESNKVSDFLESKLVGKRIAKYLQDPNNPTEEEIDHLSSLKLENFEIKFISDFSLALYDRDIDLKASDLAPRKYVDNKGLVQETYNIQKGEQKTMIVESGGKKINVPILQADVEITLGDTKFKKVFETKHFRSLRGTPANLAIGKLKGLKIFCNAFINCGISKITDNPYQIFTMEINDTSKLPVVDQKAEQAAAPKGRAKKVAA